VQERDRERGEPGREQHGERVHVVRAVLGCGARVYVMTCSRRFMFADNASSISADNASSMFSAADVMSRACACACGMSCMTCSYAVLRVDSIHDHPAVRRGVAGAWADILYIRCICESENPPGRACVICHQACIFIYVSMLDSRRTYIPLDVAMTAHLSRARRGVVGTGLSRRGPCSELINLIGMPRRRGR
jgi:hypothetical protein